jgi:hypothetical protein
MSPDLRPTIVNRLRTPNGQTWAEVHVSLRFNDVWEPPPSIIVRFPYVASNDLSSDPKELTEVILRAANNRLVELFRNAADELTQTPLEARAPSVILGPDPTR